jgi:hypothetical protein
MGIGILGSIGIGTKVAGNANEWVGLSIMREGGQWSPSFQSIHQFLGKEEEGQMCKCHLIISYWHLEKSRK